MTESKRMHTFVVGESNVDQIRYTPRGGEAAHLMKCAIDPDDVALVGQTSMWVEVFTHDGANLSLRVGGSGDSARTNAEALWSEVVHFVEP